VPSVRLPSVDNLGLEKINYSKAFNSTWVIAFMLIVIVMGWMLLDMYLQQKKNRTTS